MFCSGKTMQLPVLPLVAALHINEAWKQKAFRGLGQNVEKP
jgi:hypothetical protein